MFCRNCGNKLLDTDNFCNKCGSKVILDEPIQQQKEQNVITDNSEKEKDLPMNWWHFWQYIRFPLGILLSIFYFFQSLWEIKDMTFNIYGVLLLFLNFAIVVFLCITFYFFIKRKKHGFKILIIYSICEILYNSFVNVFDDAIFYSYSLTEMVIIALVISGIFGGIWVYPNYIYFKKREHLFKN